MLEKCSRCQGLCCRYVTIDLPAPKDEYDYDEIRWFLLHEKVIVYKRDDEKHWRIEFQSSCNYLDKEQNRCRRYNERPAVCREYTTKECGGMDEMSPEGCEIYLETEEDLKVYLEQHFPDYVPVVFKTADD